MTEVIEAPIFLSADARQKVVPLEWPLSFQGRDYEAVVVRRMTVQQIADFAESIKGKAADERVHFPVYFDRDGNAIPTQVLDNLDPDDDDALQKVALDFLPRRFRTETASVSSPPAGEPTASSPSA